MNAGVILIVNAGSSSLKFSLFRMTDFHRTHAQLADLYALPWEYYEAGARRYGFHGLSYEIIAAALPAMAPDVAHGRVIVAHLGNGARLCALNGGRSVDSTMGFSALDGIPMGTRPGALDPRVLLYLVGQRGMQTGQLEELLYKRSGLLGISGISNDMRMVVAGLSVCAVQVSTAVAYANLAGFPPETGLYASMLPVLIFGVFSSSRQLIVGPDAATCALLAALLAPLAHGDPVYYLKLSAGLAITAGWLMVIGGMTRMGFLASFFARPVLIGFLNRIALTIMAGQVGKMMGIAVVHRDFWPSLLELAQRVGETHSFSVIVGVATLALLIVLKRYAPRAPWALTALTAAGVAAFAFGLETRGVNLVGEIPSGLPSFALPGIGYEGVQGIVMDAVGLVIVSFTSTMLTARTFATRNGYSVDADQEMPALGYANMASGVFGGFVIAGADSRTAVNDASGGKTQLVSVFAALATAIVALFLAVPLGHLPTAALAAVLVF